MDLYEVYKKHEMKFIRILFLVLIVSSILRRKGIVDVLIIIAFAILSEYLDIVKRKV